MVYWLHPAWQTAATALALYALLLGWRRVMSQHMGRKAGFQWKRHVLLGKIALTAWCIGAIIGIAAVRLEWGMFFLTGAHAWTGLAFIALAAFGYASGRALDRTRQRSFWLPVLHGANNALLAILAFVQMWTGWSYLP